MALQEIGLSLLKHISSHRGLTYDPFIKVHVDQRTEFDLGTRYLTNTLEGNSLPSCQTRKTLLEKPRSLQDLPTSISSRRLVSITLLPTLQLQLTSILITASSIMAHDSDGDDETRTYPSKYGRAKE